LLAYAQQGSVSDALNLRVNRERQPREAFDGSHISFN
jgi:hypothetical protein